MKNFEKLNTIQIKQKFFGLNLEAILKKQL